jgi:hypothetical protein
VQLISRMLRASGPLGNGECQLPGTAEQPLLKRAFRQEGRNRRARGDVETLRNQDREPFQLLAGVPFQAVAGVKQQPRPGLPPAMSDR